MERERWDGGDLGGYEDLRGEGAVGAPVMDALREPTRCAAVVCLVCVRVCIMRCDFERKSRVECADWRESGREVEASAVGDTGGLNNQA